MASILILSSRSDVHALAVESHLTRLGRQVCYWSKRELPACGLAYSTASRGSSLKLSSEAGEIDFQSVQAIWLRRPGRLVAADFPEPWIKTMVENESNRALAGIFRATQALWVNDPACQDECFLKLYQLEVARRCGWDIPDTLVTNQPQTARDFIAEHKDAIIYKLIDENSHHAIPNFETPAAIPTIVLRPEDLHHLDQVAFSLHLFQRKIDKKHDLRITVVGKKIFAAAISCQYIDWRMTKENETSAADLPEEVQHRCLVLMKELGLNYGAIDVSVGKDGKFYFLEINPAGQFLWLEEKLGLPISEELANLLAGVSEPMVSA